MRVLNCTHRSHIGGAQRRIMWVASALRDVGIETQVAFPRDSHEEFAAELRDTGIEFVRAPMPPIRRSALSVALFALTLPFVAAKFALENVRRRVDLVHVNGVTNLAPLLGALLSGRRVVWHLNDTLTPRSFVRVVEPLMRLASVHVVVAADAITERYGLSGAAAPTRTLPAPAPPVGSESLSADAKAVGIPDGAAVIGFVGAIIEAKGCSDFIRAVGPVLRDHPTAHAVIIGAALNTQPRYAQRFAEEVAAMECADRVHTLGARSDVSAWMRRMDVFVLASHTEACPIVLLEAMQAGAPPVATRVGDVERMLDGIETPQVDPQDVPGLRKGIEHLLALSDEDRIALSGALRSRVDERYSLPAVAEAHMEVYRRACG
ncbi:MAG: glycosyltransferase family 4 protein [Candidatus Poribacteria bacterium]